MMKLAELKNSILLEMGLQGITDDMNRHAKKIVGSMALVAATALAPASVHAEMNAGGWLSGGVGALAGYTIGKNVGVNPTLLATTGAVIGGKVGNSAYAEAQEAKKKQAEIDAKKPLSPAMEKRVMDLLVLAGESLAIVKHNVAQSNEREVDLALSPGDPKVKASYETSVKNERVGWNTYVQNRDSYFNAVNVANKHGFNVEKYKTEAEFLIEYEKPVIGEIQERAKNAYWSKVPEPVPAPK